VPFSRYVPYVHRSQNTIQDIRVFVILLSKFLVSKNLQKEVADYINLAEHTFYLRDFVKVGINNRIL